MSTSTPSPADQGRRRTLAALVATAGAPLLARGGGARRRVGVVGAGMAGVACAWMLDGACDVVLFEAASSIGGNVQTIDVEVGGQVYPIDIGAQYFHPAAYPNYVALLAQLGLYPPSTGGSHDFPASITQFNAGQPRPGFVSPVLPGRVWPIAADWNRAGLAAFEICFAAAKLREQHDASYDLTLGVWLPRLGLTTEQWQGMLLPWCASLYNGDIEAAMGISARAALVFAAKTFPDKLTEPIVYYVLEQGMIEPLRRMAAQFTTVDLHTGAPVSAVTRTAGGFRIDASGAGVSAQVDDVVFASSGGPTLQLLAGISGTAAQRAALGRIAFFDTQMMLHTDPVYVPSEPRYASFLNSEVDGGYCEASMAMAAVYPDAPGGAPAVWKSWVTHRTSLPTQVLASASFRHLLSTPQSIHAQQALLKRQGEAGVWFAGGYTQPYDSQESALVSAMNVATGLGVAPRLGLPRA
ncbi:MAG: FAD-dependent oxidoreductase [Proteobacteria bacterium]|nr:FAD-dependent oxidoreductase [Pseudomonadota bacterium]